jgi:hypothetical protein
MLADTPAVEVDTRRAAAEHGPRGVREGSAKLGGWGGWTRTDPVAWRLGSEEWERAAEFIGRRSSAALK